jgi:hypothetical protein
MDPIVAHILEYGAYPPGFVFDDWADEGEGHFPYEGLGA